MGHMVIVYPKVWQKLGGHVDVISLKSLHLVPSISVLTMTFLISRTFTMWMYACITTKIEVGRKSVRTYVATYDFLIAKDWWDINNHPLRSKICINSIVH